MDNIWILTEERPELDSLKSILDILKDDYGLEYKFKSKKENNLKIEPIFIEKDKKIYFTFTYLLKGISSDDFGKIYINVIKGYSSFVDFMVYKQKEKPLPEKFLSDSKEKELNNNLLFVIEETKTRDKSSRNTSIYQRASKFIYVDHFYPGVDKYMMYMRSSDNTKDPTETNIFGTNLLLTLGVKFIGKDIDSKFSPFKELDDLIDANNAISPPPSKTNVPINITKTKNKDKEEIRISGRLSNPANAGNIGHDPNIGALTAISAVIRKLGYEGDIVITDHQVREDKVKNMRGNKFLYLSKILDISLENIDIYDEKLKEIEFLESYWEYDKKGEKNVSILVDILAENNDYKVIYSNHAGSARSDLITKENKSVKIPKENRMGEKIPLPDLVVCKKGKITIMEAKTFENLEEGILEMESLDIFETFILDNYYKDYETDIELIIFGGEESSNVEEDYSDKILIQLFENGLFKDNFFGNTLFYCK